jgi:superfamily II DNA or RNA helicase
VKGEPLDAASLVPGARVTHGELGDGVVIQPLATGYVRAFFGDGERLVHASALRSVSSWNERLISCVAGGRMRQEQAWLAWEALDLPSSETGPALTAARVDLLPHQIVLTHRIATASPRRFLIADEVGLGKTIETALILRELSSRGELRRALLIVPAGLVNNWHRELNEVFNLDFEVFGPEGDVTDRRSNAFAKHDRLIASVDTVKRPARVRRLLEAPAWDLVVFDEAHHLSAHRSGGKIRRTENFKLAEALRGHSRDLLLLSATPHQGDHFRFWMLIQLLKPTLFRDPDDMLANRHRLNEVVFRRTKADACRADGSPLFARRSVHTEAFDMAEHERHFYDELRSYLEDGFALARQRGSQGQALGFLMAVFQKIAASSFAAVQRTLRRRLIALTIHEAMLRDRALEADRREALLDEARELIHSEFKIERAVLGHSEVDRLLADFKLRILKRAEAEGSLEGPADDFASELEAGGAENAVAETVNVALPEERGRIRRLLELAPGSRETKVEKLLAALEAIWEANPLEKVVIFATYLGTVELLEQELGRARPEKGVTVLRGGDHGAKLAAERRFRQPDGPRILICTAAGREGINLQFARVLFNFDLPWNPMDLEQRIGRIHRYGQQHTAQVYNLVLGDTIEGRIFLLLNEKLLEIARTLGKVDERGEVAEDLRAQILGQLAERLSYERLFREGLSDPDLRRTREELQAALANASEAREVVFELFQDLDRFSLDEYRPLAATGGGMSRLLAFVQRALKVRGEALVSKADALLEWRDSSDGLVACFTSDRDRAMRDPNVHLLGLDHPRIRSLLDEFRGLPAEERAVAVRAGGIGPSVISLWEVDVHGKGGERRRGGVCLAVGIDGSRAPHLERELPAICSADAAEPRLTDEQRLLLVRDVLDPMLQREVRRRFGLDAEAGYGARLSGWFELS